MKIAVETQKSEFIEIPNPSDLKCRLIASGPLCPTNRLGKPIDIPIQPFLYKTKSYISKDIYFLNSIQKISGPDALMVTFEVTNQYTNISHGWKNI